MTSQGTAPIGIGIDKEYEDEEEDKYNKQKLDETIHFLTYIDDEKKNRLNTDDQKNPKEDLQNILTPL